MLASRYIHLHEALGLGPMWLKQTARILPSHSVNTTTINQHTQHAPTTQQPSVAAPKPTTSSARLTTLQHVSNHIKQTNNLIDPTTTTANNNHTNTPISTQEWLQTLSGSITPVKLMALSVCASPADIAAGKLLSGEEGTLFNKMLAAIHLMPQEVFLTTWLKDLPDFLPKPPIEKVAEAFPRVQAEYELSGRPILLLLGDFFQRPDVIVHIKQLNSNVAYFHIPHPMRILNNPTLKRPAWDTLQIMQRHLLSKS